MQDAMRIGIDHVSAASRQAEVITSRSSFLLWLGASATLVICFDLVFSFYKIITFREAIPSQSDFFGVVLIYASASVASAGTFAGYLIGLRDRAHGANLVTVLAACGIAICVGLLSVNMLGLPEWSSLALLGKTDSLVGCVIFGLILMYLNRPPPPPLDSVK